MGPSVPPGQSPPFEVVDEYHHGAWIIITAALGLVVSLVGFLIRLYVRLMLIPPFARDDFVLLGATTAAVVQSTLIFYACSRGLGTSLTLLNENRLNQIQTLIATSDVFALIIVYLSKCCVVAIYLRLTPQKPHNRASWATLALCTAWVVPAVFILLVNCELNRPWRVEGAQCRNLFKRWQFITAVDVITEFLLVALAVALLKDLFMSVKRKLAIGFAFVFRFPLIIFSILHISTLHSALASKDVTLAAVEPTLWLQAEVHYALIACSVFCLRPFMAAVSTNYGTAGDENLEHDASASRSRGTKGSGSGSGSNTNSRSRSLSRVSRKRAGTVSRSRTHKNARSRSSSREKLCQNEEPHDRDAQRDGHKKTQAPSHASHERSTPIRFPIRRSIFPLGVRANQGPSRIDKGKDGVRGASSTPSLADVDAIELMPPLNRQRARQEGDGPFEVVEPERMVIRKEVQYSIQYEYDEARKRGEGSCKEGCTDATAYV